jgi:N-acyl-D-amino-acid deacylase
MEEEAWDRGIRCTFDVVPYTQLMPPLVHIYPPWAKIGGLLLENLKDKKIRKRLAKEVENAIPTWPPWAKKGGWIQNYVKVLGWDHIRIFSVVSNNNKPYMNKSLLEYAKLVHKTPFEAACDLLLEEERQGGEIRIAINVSGDDTNEEPLIKLIRSPIGGPCTDAWDVGWKKPQPRAYGTFPRFLCHYIRDKKIIRIEEAVRRMTSLQAQAFGLSKRGMLKEGMKADINIFDLSRIKEKATYDNPRQISEGLDYVIINGRAAVKEGEYQSKLFGKVLRKVR